jgi:hypothetical protein
MPWFGVEQISLMTGGAGGTPQRLQDNNRLAPQRWLRPVRVGAK